MNTQASRDGDHPLIVICSLCGAYCDPAQWIEEDGAPPQYLCDDCSDLLENEET
jgi:hypothetical protein